MTEAEPGGGGLAGSADPVRPADLVLDCRGLRCPLPVIELARRVGEVSVGGVVEVLSDDPAAATDVPAWCRMRGHEYLGSGAAEGVPAYRVRRV